MESSSSSSSSSSVVISPRKLRTDLYSYPYQKDSNTPLVISVLASLISRTMARNERVARNSPRGYSRNLRTGVFDCHETPDMTIQSYLERIFRYTGAGPSVYVVAYVYIDRFCQFNPGFRIAASNVHRLLITTIMVASKYVEDMWVIRNKTPPWPPFTQHTKLSQLSSLVSSYSLSPQELQKFILRESGRIDHRRDERTGGGVSVPDGLQTACECERFRELLQPFREGGEHRRRIPHREDPQMRWRDQIQADCREEIHSDCQSHFVNYKFYFFCLFRSKVILIVYIERMYEMFQFFFFCSEVWGKE